MPKLTNMRPRMIIVKYLKDILDIIVTTYHEWVDDQAFKMAAALSFYSLISLAPFLIIITAVTGFIFGQKAVTGQIVTGIEEYVGASVAKMIQSLILNASVPGSGIIAVTIGFIVFIWASLAVFVEIRDSLNYIWGLQAKPGKGVRTFFAGRLFSLLILFLIGLLFILSLITGTLLDMANNFLAQFFPTAIPVVQWIDLIMSFAIVTILFAIIIKYLPMVKIEWKYVLTGAIVSSLLFNLGRYAIGFYLRNTIYSSVYGAAGSLVILLLWIYYSSLIFFFGAELTQVMRKKMSGESLQFGKNALKIAKVTEQVNDSMSE
jgi:membrane protein